MASTLSDLESAVSKLTADSAATKTQVQAVADSTSQAIADLKAAINAQPDYDSLVSAVQAATTSLEASNAQLTTIASDATAADPGAPAAAPVNPAPPAS